MGVEIERKFTIKNLPEGLERFPFHRIEQGYLNVSPAVRVRREDDSYYMTYKGNRNADGIGQTEYNMPLDAKSYGHLIAKADGNVISKRRYLIPLNEDGFSKEFLRDHKDIADMIRNGDIKIELDVFEGVYRGRVLAEVEFPSKEVALLYNPASWFGEDVSGDQRYSNAYMSTEKVVLA